MTTPYQHTHDAGRLYWHTMRVPRDSPLLQRDGKTREVEQPWRVGHSWVLRVFGAALVVGWWGAARTDEQMLADEAAADDFRTPSITPDDIRVDFRAPADAYTVNAAALYEVR